MLPRAVRIAYALPMLFSLVIASLLIIRIEETGFVTSGAAVTASETTTARPADDVASALERAARKAHTDVFREFADRTSPSSSRRLLVAPGSDASAGASWIRDGSRRSFNPAISTEVSTMQSLGTFDPAGTYMVHGDATAVNIVRSALHSVGYSTHVEAMPSRFVVATSSLSGSPGAASALMLGMVCVLCAAGVLTDPRRSAVRQAWGVSHARTVGRTVRQVGTSIGWSSLVLIPAGVGLGALNGFADVGSFLSVASVYFGMMVTALGITHALCGWIQTRTPIAEAIRGSRPSAGVVGAAQIARIPITCISVATVGIAVVNLAIVRASDATSTLQAAGAATVLSLTGDRGKLDEKTLWPRLGRFVQAALRNDEAFLVVKTEIALGRDPDASVLPALVVDGGYLDRQHLVDNADERITPDPSRVRVFLSTDDTATVRWTRETALEIANDLNTGEPGRIERLRSDQRAYTYPGESAQPQWIDDPILVVVPDAGRFPADQLGSLLSTADVLFADQVNAERLAAEHELTSQFRSIVPLAQAVADEARAAEAEARIAIVTAVFGSGVGIVAATIAALAHRRRFAEAVFARYSNGWSFLRANRALLVIELLIALSGLVVALNAQPNTDPALGPSVAPDSVVAQSAAPAFVAAGLTILVLSIASVASLAITARRSVRTHGKES